MNHISFFIYFLFHIIKNNPKMKNNLPPEICSHTDIQCRACLAEAEGALSINKREKSKWREKKKMRAGGGGGEEEEE